jgi:hypothetical protein
MASNLFNKNWDRATSPIVGAPRSDQIVQGFSPLKWPRDTISSIEGAPGSHQVFQGNFASSPIRNQSPLRSTQSPLRSTQSPITPTQAPVNISLDFDISKVSLEGLFPDQVTDQIARHVSDVLREAWDEYVKDLEARLLAVICEKLKKNGRIAPGEPLLREPNPNGRGFTLYRFPG